MKNTEEAYRLSDIALWCLVPIFTGTLLHFTMPELGWKEHENAIIFFGLSVFTFVVSTPLYLRNKIGLLCSAEMALALLIICSAISLIGAIIPETQSPSVFSAHRSYYFAGMLGFLAGTQLLIIKQDFSSDISGVRFLGKTSAHLGIALIVLAGAIGGIWGTQGIMTLFSGGESTVFSVTEGPFRLLTGEVRSLAGCNVVLSGDVNTDDYAGDYKSYFVNCSPGFPVAVPGMILLLAGATGLFVFSAKKSFGGSKFPKYLLFIIPVPFLIRAVINYQSFPEKLQSIWFIPHVFSYFTGYAFIFLASAIALQGLLIRSKRCKAMQFADMYTSAGFLFLSSGICLGSIWANEAWGSWWSWDVKESVALSQWLLIAAFKHMPNKWKLSIQGISLLLITLLLTSFLYSGIGVLPDSSTSLHIYTE